MKSLSQKKILELEQKVVIRVYSFQHLGTLNMLDKEGYIAGGPNFAYKCLKHNLECDDLSNFKLAYGWMQGQMKDRLENYSGDLPIWAWPTRPNTRLMRSISDYPCVRIIADVPASRVLKSDFYLWHDVLNEQYCSLTEKEFDSIGEPTEKQVENSWNRIFDIITTKTKEQAEWLGPTRMIQYCIDRIYKSEIVSIKHIT